MLPVEESVWVGKELEKRYFLELVTNFSRFGLPRWQFALTATDANRFAVSLLILMKY
jgi:glutamate-1-semialdehyde 2,1-aminomutase